jgi:hypothetical protein
MLLREGIIDEIPASLCSNSANGKNVMLVVGDGMVSDIDPLFTFFHYASHFVCNYLVTSYKVVKNAKKNIFCFVVRDGKWSVLEQSPRQSLMN